MKNIYHTTNNHKTTYTRVALKSNIYNHLICFLYFLFLSCFAVLLLTSSTLSHANEITIPIASETILDHGELDHVFDSPLDHTFTTFQIGSPIKPVLITLHSIGSALPILRDTIKNYVAPHLTTYSENPKYTIYDADGSLLTLVSKITPDSRLGTIFNEWTFHGSTLNIAEKAKEIYDLATKLKIGQNYYVTIDVHSKELIKFEYEIDSTNKVVIEFPKYTLGHTDENVLIYKDVISYELHLTYVTGSIRGNFSNSAIAVGENANFVNHFADVFSSDIDFSREIQNGDTFTAIIEKRYRDGEFISYGDILAAQLVNRGNTYNAYYFYETMEDDDQENTAKSQDTQNQQIANQTQNTKTVDSPNQNTNNTSNEANTNTLEENQTHTNINTLVEKRPPCVYFDEKGNARQKAFLRSPVHFTRVSSVYTMSRRHPILGVSRPHQGIDYAAPLGTPVYTVGDGTVTYIGWSGGYGKLIKVRHSGGLESQYAHLSRYASGLRVGARVLQGETIGYVGSTGLSTGPHLDFRIKKNGQFVNPDSIIIPSKAPVTQNRMESYLQHVEILNAYLNDEKSLLEYDPTTWLAAPAPPE